MSELNIRHHDNGVTGGDAQRMRAVYELDDTYFLAGIPWHQGLVVNLDAPEWILTGRVVALPARINPDGEQRPPCQFAEHLLRSGY